MTGGGHKHDDQYMMYEFKVKPCPRLDHHNWKHCPHRHPGEVAAQRRHPSLHKPAFCMNLKLYGSCAAGDDCPFSHNTFEMSLHPERYKTTLCTLGDKCNREICFFAHGTEDLRTPDVTAPLGAMGQETTITLAQLGGVNGLTGSSAPPAADAALSDGFAQVGVDSRAVLQQHQVQQAGGQQGDLQHLLRQVEQQLQLDPSAQQQQLLQQEQQALLVAQVSQQQMSELVLTQRQLMLANAAGNAGGGVLNSSQVVNNNGMLSPQSILSSGMAAANTLQRGAAGQQQYVPVMLQDTAAHRGESSFTSQCSTSSYVSGIGALRAAGGPLPVSPLIDRSAQSFTVTDRSTTGSFSTLGSVPERPHSFSVGDRPQVANLLASLGERPQSFTLLDTSHTNSFTLGQQSPAAFAVERSAASFSVLETSHRGLAIETPLSVVERNAQTQRSFTMGQRPQLQQDVAWYERDIPAASMLSPSAGAGQPDGKDIYQLLASQTQLQEPAQQQQQQSGGRLGLSALWQWR